MASKECAEEFGLEIGYDKRIGHSPTTVPQATQDAYSEQIDALEKALTLYRVTEVTPIEDGTPAELHYLYPDGTEFSVFPNRDGEIVFVQETFDSFVSRLGAKPAPKKYEDGLYVDKDGDEVLWRNGRLWTGEENRPEEYLKKYGPLTPKEDQ